MATLPYDCPKCGAPIMNYSGVCMACGYGMKGERTKMSPSKKRVDEVLYRLIQHQMHFRDQSHDNVGASLGNAILLIQDLQRRVEELEGGNVVTMPARK